MVKSTTPIKPEEPPERIAGYHHGKENSIRNVMRSLKEELGVSGVALSGVEDKDIGEDDDEIKEPPDEPTREIKEPPRKPAR